MLVSEYEDYEQSDTTNEAVSGAGAERNGPLRRRMSEEQWRVQGRSFWPRDEDSGGVIKIQIETAFPRPAKAGSKGAANTSLHLKRLTPPCP